MVEVRIHLHIEYTNMINQDFGTKCKQVRWGGGGGGGGSNTTYVCSMLQLSCSAIAPEVCTYVAILHALHADLDTKFVFTPKSPLMVSFSLSYLKCQ